MFILKPQQARFAAVPENEHVTMLMARLVGIPTPVCGLTRLADGALAYLVRRFDREHGAKQRVEDFCQLAEKSPSEKYDGSAELCVRLTQPVALAAAPREAPPSTAARLDPIPLDLNPAQRNMVQVIDT